MEKDSFFCSECGILVELEDIFLEEHYLDEPSILDFSELTPPDQLIDLISDESSPDLAPIPPISPRSSPLPTFPLSLEPTVSTFVESNILRLVVLV